MTTGSDAGGGGRGEAGLCLAARSASDRSLCCLNDFASNETVEKVTAEYIHIFKSIYSHIFLNLSFQIFLCFLASYVTSKQSTA